MSIEIKVGQKYRIVDNSSTGFASCTKQEGDIITVSEILSDGDALVEESKFLYIERDDIQYGYVELVEDNPEEILEQKFDSITTQIPPVGTKCLYSFGGTMWWECEVIAQERPVVYCPHINNIQVVDEEECEVFFKPLPEEKPKSAAQIRMEEIEKQMRELADELRELREDDAEYDSDGDFDVC